MILTALAATAALLLQTPPAQADGRACVYFPAMKRLSSVPSRNGGQPFGQGWLIREGRAIPFASTRFRHARNQPWAASATLVFQGVTYKKFGDPRTISPSEVAPLGDIQGVMVAAETGDTSGELIFVQYDVFDCSVQPYERVK